MRELATRTTKIPALTQEERPSASLFAAFINSRTYPALLSAFSMNGLSLPFSFADVFAAPAERLWQNGNRAIPAVRILPLVTPWG